MSLPHLGALKVATWVSGILAAVVVAMDPTVTVALIAIIPLTITGIGTLWLQFLVRRDTQKSLANQAEMKSSMDGHFTKLLEEKAQDKVEIIDKTDKLAHAKGRREGLEQNQKEKQK